MRDIGVESRRGFVQRVEKEILTLESKQERQWVAGFRHHYLILPFYAAEGIFWHTVKSNG